MTYDDFTPDELLTKAIRKELPMWKVNLHLQLREKRYAQFDFGTDPNYEGAIPLEEWSKKYAAVANTLKKIEILQRPTPPCVKFDCTSTMEKLREIRDECITGERDRDVALAVFDKRVQDCKNDLLSVVEHSVTKTYGFIFELTQTETLIHEYAEKVIEGGWNKAMASFDVIRAEIEAAPDTQTPEETQAAVTASCLTDVEIINLLEPYIEINKTIKDKTIYAKKRGTSVVAIFDKIKDITGSYERARLFMKQNMRGVEMTLNTHRPKHRYHD